MHCAKVGRYIMRNGGPTIYKRRAKQNTPRAPFTSHTAEDAASENAPGPADESERARGAQHTAQAKAKKQKRKKRIKSPLGCYKGKRGARNTRSAMLGGGARRHAM